MSKRHYSIGAEEKILNKCPLCGSVLEYSSLHQYSLVHKVLKNGTLSKTFKKRDCGSMECGFISCTNEECDFHTDCDLDVEDYNEIHIYQNDDKFMYEDDRLN